MIKRLATFALTASLVLGFAGCDDGPAAGDAESPHIIHVTDGDFAQRVLEAEMPVLVDFWAEWCGPCRMQAPALAEVADHYAGKAIVAKLDIDAHAATPTQYGVDAIPTMVLFVDGKEARRFVGLTEREAIERAIDRFLPESPAAPAESPAKPGA